MKDLKKMVENGEIQAQDHDARVKEAQERQEKERQYKEMRENMSKRKAALKESIEMMRLEVEYINLKNEYSQGLLEEWNLGKDLDEIKKEMNVKDPVTDNEI